MAALIDLVNFQFENAKALSAVLRQETQAISVRTSTEIENIAKEKMRIIEQLGNTDQRIASHPHLNQLTDDEYLSQLVTQIQSIILDCKNINTVNGESLNRAQSSFNKLNNMLQHTHGKIGMTYNAGGKTHTISTLGTNFKA